MPTIYDNETNRSKALKRATKMQKLLFDAKNFGSIMNAVEPALDQKAFETACQNAGLNPKETTWLLTYLKQCTKAVYETVPEAAATGW